MGTLFHAKEDLVLWCLLPQILDAAANVLGEHKFDIIIDEDLGSNTTITVLCDQASRLQVQQLYPMGHVCENCHQAGLSTTDSYITFKAPGIATVNKPRG